MSEAMDFIETFNSFLFQLAILLITNVNCELVSTSLEADTDIRCANPFLSLSTIGYIQCQKACIRYSDCEVLSYTKSQLECKLYAGENCWSYSGDSDSNIYKQRNSIKEATGGSCHHLLCPASTVCVETKISSQCFPDEAKRSSLLESKPLHHRGDDLQSMKINLQAFALANDCVITVPSPYEDSRPTSVNIDSVKFWVYPIVKTYDDADKCCESVSGRLAVLDTDEKRRRIYEEGKKHYQHASLFVGVKRNEKGVWYWNNGVTALVPFVNKDGNCAILYNYALHDLSCDALLWFVCEMI